MRFIRRYEEFRFKDEVLDTTTKEILVDNPIDSKLLNEPDDKESYLDEKGVIHIKNWKVY
jgi:hypothetical protein